MMLTTHSTRHTYDECTARAWQVMIESNCGRVAGRSVYSTQRKETSHEGASRDKLAPAGSIAMNIHILHTQEQACIGCGAIEQWSTLYQAEDLPAPGKAHKLLPCHHVGPYDYVHKVELPPRLVPICTQCVTTHAAGADLYARWQETLQRKSEERRVFVKAVKESRLEDLA